MPGRDGTGPMGYGPMTGGRRGFCAGAYPSAGPGGGRGWRNQFYATGLTGWQRAAQDIPQPVDAAASVADPFTRLESKLGEAIERLERLETAGQK
jgi:Family of unknown function (DUF5320)